MNLFTLYLLLLHTTTHTVCVCVFLYVYMYNCMVFNTLVSIDVPWGRISGKAWGSPSGRPVLSLHGMYWLYTVYWNVQ